jgi:hypothetical protein
MERLFECECYRCKAFARELARLERAFGEIEVYDESEERVLTDSA